MKYSVVIPTYNHCDDLLRPCIDTIKQYTDFSKGDIEIIISANGCKDNTKEYVESLGEPFKLVWDDNPTGYAAATNDGIIESSGEYIILLNNDIILLDQNINQWIDMLVQPFFRDSSIGITGPLRGYSGPADRDFIIFFCAMISKTLVDKIGLLDTIFGVGGGEDTDYCIRAQDEGFKIHQVPSNDIRYPESDPNSNFMVGSYPIYHVGEATMYDKNCVSDYTSIFNKNSDILCRKYNTKWKLSNNYERAVIDAHEDVNRFPREVTRYQFAAKNLKGRKILEIGCSSGYGTRFLPKDIDYTGLDYDCDIVKYATEQFGDSNHKFIHCDIHKFEFTEHYDTIIAFEVIEHLNDGKEIAQMLRDHCDVLLITTPYNEQILGYYDKQELNGEIVKRPYSMWGHHHLLHNLTRDSFPYFDYSFISEDGRLINSPELNNGLNLMLMKWDCSKIYPKTNIRVTAYVPTKNRYDSTLSLTIVSIINQTRKPNKFILVDDSDNKRDLRDDPTYSYIFSLLDVSGIEWSVVFASGKGVTHNHQMVLDISDTDWLWRIDDDCIVEPNVLDTLISNIDEKTGSIGGCIINPKNNKKCSIASNKIVDVSLCLNEQWFIPDDKSVKQVDHLYSSFLYRKSASIHGYNLHLSPIGHTEETWFTYQMKRNGWDIKFDPKCMTHHLQNSTGGIRSYKDNQFVKNDSYMFNQKLIEWGVSLNKYKIIVLNNGLGDHCAFKSIFHKIFEKYNDHIFIISCCYPDLFSDIDKTKLKLISIEEYNSHFGSDEYYNIYRYLTEYKDEKLTLIQAYERMYL